MRRPIGVVGAEKCALLIQRVRQPTQLRGRERTPTSEATPPQQRPEPKEKPACLAADGLFKEGGIEVPSSDRRRQYHASGAVKQFLDEYVAPPGQWRRHSAEKDGIARRPDLTNEGVLRALRGTHLHGGRRWSENDQRTMAEVDARSWRWLELGQRRFLSVPAWITPDVADRRYHLFLGLLVAAYRTGALGLLISYEEGAAFFGCSRRTWARWVKRMLEVGLIRVLPTWVDSSSDGRGRDRGRNLYQLGPELLEMAGEGLMEGKGDGAIRRLRLRVAGKLRKDAKRRRREALGSTWAAQRAAREEEREQAAAPLDPPNPSATLAPHSPPGPASPGLGPEGEGEASLRMQSKEPAAAGEIFSNAADDGPVEAIDPPDTTANTPRPPQPSFLRLIPAPKTDTASGQEAGASIVPPPGQPAAPGPRTDASTSDTSRRSRSAAATGFGDAVRDDAQLSFWKSLPRSVLAEWGLDPDGPPCRRCKGHGELASEDGIAPPARCRRCGGSGVDPNSKA